MPPIKRNGNGSYEVSERVINWSAIILVLITGGGVGTFGVLRSSDRWTDVQAAESHKVLAKVDAELESRVRDNERDLSMLGGPNDPLAPRVDKLERKIDSVLETVNGNALALRELKTILRERERVR